MPVAARSISELPPWADDFFKHLRAGYGPEASAEFAGVTKVTAYRWFNDHKEFRMRWRRVLALRYDQDLDNRHQEARIRFAQ